MAQTADGAAGPLVEFALEQVVLPAEARTAPAAAAAPGDLPREEATPIDLPREDAPAADLPREGAAPAASRAAAAAEELDDDDGQPCDPTPEPVLSVRLSKQLHSRLLRTAHEEGVSLDALVQELLAEGVTLRAWEIIERKSAMRGLSNQPPPAGPNNRGYGNGPGNGPGNPRPGHNNGNNRGNPNGNTRGAFHNHGGNQQNRRPSGAPANNAWMEDKAAFLEYVRNQEKNRRR